MQENPRLESEPSSMRNRSFPNKLLCLSRSQTKSKRRTQNNGRSKSFDQSLNQFSLFHPSEPRDSEYNILDQKCNTIESNLEVSKTNSFTFSQKNFYPRKNNFFMREEKKKFSPFDYYSNNYLPARISPRKSLLTLENLSWQNSAPGPVNKNYLKVVEDGLIKFPSEETLSTKSSSPNFSIDAQSMGSSGGKERQFKRNFNNAPEEQKGGDILTKKGQFIERQGDWICMKCKNLNFSFRIVCNRCKLSKTDSEMLYHEHMYNIMNFAKYKEFVSKNLMANQQMFPMHDGNHIPIPPQMFMFNPYMVACHPPQTTPFKDTLN